MARIMAGLEKFGLKPFIVPQENGNGPRSVDRPAGSVTTTSRGVKLIEPFLVNMRGKSKGASVNKPTPAVTGGQNLMLAEPFIVPNFGEREGQEPRVHSIDAPAPAVTGRGAGNLIQPCLIKMRGTNNAADVDKPSPTVTGSQTLALAEFIIQTDQTGSNGSCARSTSKPLGAVVSKQNVALVRHVARADPGSDEPVARRFLLARP